MPENGLNEKIIKDCHISILALVFIEINPKTMAKKLILFGFLLFFLGKIGFSQQTIAATEIMKDLRAGKDISISNATIVGNLDFTLMEEQIEKLPSKRIPPKRNNTI